MCSLYIITHISTSFNEAISTIRVLTHQSKEEQAKKEWGKHPDALLPK